MRAPGLWPRYPLGFNLSRPSERPDDPTTGAYFGPRPPGTRSRTGTLRRYHLHERGWEVVASFERHQNYKSVFDPYDGGVVG